MREAGELKEVKEVRKLCGMPELTYQRVRCRRMMDHSDHRVVQCKNFFRAEFKGQAQTTFFCHYCKYRINEGCAHTEFKIG